MVDSVLDLDGCSMVRSFANGRVRDGCELHAEFEKLRRRGNSSPSGLLLHRVDSLRESIVDKKQL